MTKTKIKYSTVLIAIGVPVVGIGLASWMLYSWADQDFSLFLKFFAFPLVTIATVLTAILELPKLKSVEIHDDRLVFKSLLTGRKKEIPYTTFDGFKTNSQLTRYGLVYEMVLVVNGRQFHDISSNYVDNYNSVRAALGKRLSNLGTEKFSFYKYIKERLTI